MTDLAQFSTSELMDDHAELIAGIELAQKLLEAGIAPSLVGTESIRRELKDFQRTLKIIDAELERRGDT